MWATNWVNIGLDDGMSPVRYQATIYTKVDTHPLHPEQQTSMKNIETNQFSLQKLHFFNLVTIKSW